MKILFASSSSGSRGGGEMYLVYLGRALSERGHEVSLWTSRHERMDEVAHSFSQFGAVSRSPYRNTYDRRGRSLAAFFDRKAARSAAAEWKALSPEIVHINKQNLEDGLDLLGAAEICKLPSVCTIHLTQTARFLGAQLAWLRDVIARTALLRYAGAFVTVLDARAYDLERILGGKPAVRTVVTGIPLFNLSTRAEMRARKRAELGIEDDKPLVIGLGRMTAQKRPLLFLEAARDAKASGAQTRFLWIGDGPLAPEWNRFVTDHDLGSTVGCAGWQAEIAPHLAAADLLLHVAQYEGLPLALLEAMSAALPCAVTQNISEEMPFLAEARPIVLDEAAPKLPALDLCDLRARGAASRTLVEATFSFERMACEYEAIYRESMNSRRPA